MKIPSLLVAVAIISIVFFPLTQGLGSVLATPLLIGAENQKMHLPKAAKFFPKETVLTLHWQSDLKDIPQYFESLASNETKKQTREESIQFIHGHRILLAH